MPLVIAWLQLKAHSGEKPKIPGKCRWLCDACNANYEETDNWRVLHAVKAIEITKCCEGNGDHKIFFKKSNVDNDGLSKAVNIVNIGWA